MPATLLRLVNIRLVNIGLIPLCTISSEATQQPSPPLTISKFSNIVADAAFMRGIHSCLVHLCGFLFSGRMQAIALVRPAFFEDMLDQAGQPRSVQIKASYLVRTDVGGWWGAKGGWRGGGGLVPVADWSRMCSC